MNTKQEKALLWVKTNLFNKWYNSVISVVLIGVLGYLGFYAVRFLLVTSNWAPVRENLTLFMIGRFPRADQWRILTQIALMSSAIGLTWGLYVSRPRDEPPQNVDSQNTSGGTTTNESSAKSTQKSFAKRYWPILLLIVALLSLTQTLLPLLFVGIIAASIVGMYWIGKVVPIKLEGNFKEFGRNLRGLGHYLAGLSVLISWQILSGTKGTAWIWVAAITAIAVIRTCRNYELHWWITILITAGITGGIWIVYRIFSITGVSWEQWSGFHLNLTITLISLVFAFPLGILLALGRRSNLPAVKYISVGYIELIRGVPLIGLLFVGNLFLGFFLDRASSISTITRAAVILAIFTSAYMAEIFRGGLRAVSKDQIDAAKAIGLNPFQSFVWVVFPQALRVIIPALVGQSISLFKDTSLLTIISIVEILRVRRIVHAQTDFLSIGIAETLIFVSFAFWAISYTMSTESQRLETKLGLGSR